MAAMPPDTTIAFFAREEGKTKAPAALHAAVKSAKGQIVAEATIKPWELAGWVREQATRLGLSLDAFAAKTLVAQVGERQQRLLRELEKLKLAAEPDAETPIQVSADDIERQAAHSTAYRAFTFADALVGGDAAEAMRSYLRLRTQGERLSGLVYLMAQRLRDAEGVPHEIDMQRAVAHRIELEIARDHAVLGAVDLDLENAGEKPAAENALVQLVLIERNAERRLIVAIDHARHAAFATHGARGSFAGLRPGHSLQFIDPRHCRILP